MLFTRGMMEDQLKQLMEMIAAGQESISAGFKNLAADFKDLAAKQESTSSDIKDLAATTSSDIKDLAVTTSSDIKALAAKQESMATKQELTSASVDGFIEHIENVLQSIKRDIYTIYNYSTKSQIRNPRDRGNSRLFRISGHFTIFSNKKRTSSNSRAPGKLLVNDTALGAISEEISAIK